MWPWIIQSNDNNLNWCYIKHNILSQNQAFKYDGNTYIKSVCVGRAPRHKYKAVNQTVMK